MLRALYIVICCSACLLVLSPAGRSAEALDHTAPAARDATSYPAVDTHQNEQVSIAADPYDTKEKCSIFRMDYLKYGILPVRIIVTNNSDHSISLADARINFITADGDKIQTSEIPDVERRMVPVNRTDNPGKNELHIPGMKSKAAKTVRAITDDFRDFEYSDAMVAPHSTRSGFFFYDVEDLDHPLAGAKLSLTTLRDAQGNELFSFEIPFNRYLAASPKK
jgi:hypothetical protein